MSCFKEVKLLYASVILLLEADILVHTKAVESKSSIMTNSHDVNDFKSLEMCTSKNQQRLGNVFGNFTRHHRKGHKRRMNSSYLSSSAASTLDGFKNASTVLQFPTLHPKSTTAQLLSALEDYSRRNMIHIDSNLQPIHEVRHRNRLLERIREIDPESTKDTVKKRMNISNKMLRETNSADITLNGRSTRRGIFLTENCTTVTAQIGTTAVMHCEVSDITESTVTWIRKKDHSLLSVGLVTYSADNRYFTAHGKHIKDWALHVRFVTPADAGFYECQVPTHPPTSIFFKLVLVAAFAEINGESEKIIHDGSMLRLVCVVKRSTETPSYVFWYFEQRMINYDLNGVTVNNGRESSELVIRAAKPRHAGNYTCVPANARPSSVTVHVVQSETPAAMQHGNNSPAPAPCAHQPMFALLLFKIMLL